MKDNFPTDDYQEGALYIRVSTDKQEELSPDAQKRLGLEYAKKNKIMVSPEHIYIENGISGRHADKRPAFQKMISNAKQKPAPFQVILVWKFSRFARNQEESIVYKSLLRKQCNIDVVSISEPLIEGPFGSLIERIIEWMDEYYSIRLSGEVVRGMTEKALRGGYQAAPCLGYNAVSDGKPFVINEEEFKIVEYICNQYDHLHLEPTSIARKVNAMGYRTKRGNTFEKRSIEYILKNPFYAGIVIWNGNKFMGTHEVRFNLEQYEARIARLNSEFRPVKRRSVSTCQHWLSGLIRCPICGSTLAYNKRESNGNGFFQCWQYSKGMHPGSMCISEKKLYDGVIRYFESVLNGMNFEYRYALPDNRSDNSELDLLKAQLEKLKNREQRIQLAYENGIDTLEEYKENKSRIKKEREEIEKMIASYTPPEPQSLSNEDVKKCIQKVYDVVKNPAIDYEVKGVFMRSLVEEIIYDKDNKRLLFHLYISNPL